MNHSEASSHDHRIGEVVLRLRGIRKSYGAVQALKGVDFELRSGEVMALLGENGAGKSTAVKIMSGLESPDDGEILIDGTAATIGSTQRSRQFGIAVAEQELSIIGSLTVAENIFIAGVPFTGVWTKRRLAAAARPHLEAVGLEHVDPATLAEELSVAERQLVEIARLLAQNARILILDEPTAALSDSEIERVKSTVTRLAQSGRAIVYVTHRLGEVFEIAHRVTVFRGGKSAAPQPTGALTLESLIEQMIGRPLEDLYPGRRDTFGDAVCLVDGVRTAELSAEVALRARAGEIVGIAGQVGSGAGSILRAIAGVDRLAAGRVEVAGEPLSSGHRLPEAIRAGVAYVSADRKLDGIFAGLSVTKNLSAPALSLVSRLGVLRGSSERELVDTSAVAVAFDPARVHHLAGNLSGGNQQKVALGKWLGRSPRVLLVHEPTRGVDVGARAEIYRRLRQFADDGMAIVFASSDLEEVHGLADTIVTMYRGRVVRTTAGGALSTNDILKDITHPEVSGA